MPSDESETTPMTLAAFLHLPDAVRRLVRLQDGQLMPADPRDPAAQDAYQRALAALAAGDITVLRPRDR